MNAKTARPTRPHLTFHEVDEDHWPDLAELFNSRGGPKNCWCMAWRPHKAGARRADAASRENALKSSVQAGVPIGILGYCDNSPVAWCSVAPRTTYRTLGGPAVSGDPDERIWSIACLFITRALRGQAISAQLIAAAVEQARRRGATIVESYPVDPDSPSYRFMGFVKAFEQAGFEEIGRAGTRRHVMRLKIGTKN
jgi:GNAT superfamily N-acetyltransferase